MGSQRDWWQSRDKVKASCVLEWRRSGEKDAASSGPSAANKLEFKIIQMLADLDVEVVYSEGPQELCKRGPTKLAAEDARGAVDSRRCKAEMRVWIEQLKDLGIVMSSVEEPATISQLCQMEMRGQVEEGVWEAKSSVFVQFFKRSLVGSSGIFKTKGGGVFAVADDQDLVAKWGS